MPSFSYFGRCLAAALTLFSIAFLGISNVGTSDAQPLNRPRLGKLAVATQATLQTRLRDRERSHAKQAGRCTFHKRSTCAKRHARQARYVGKSTPSISTILWQRITQKATPPRTSPPASSAGSGQTTSGAGSGQSTSGSGSGSTESTKSAPTEKSSDSSGSTSGEKSLAAGGSSSGESPVTSGSGSSPSSETFGLPFVKGITANFAGEGPNNVPEEVSEMRSLGVNWTREALDWSEAEPERGVFDWSSFDQVVAEAKANGITVLPLLGYAPSWTSPTDSAAYAEFVAAAVARYGPGTSANLQWWELWNEPYFAYAWSGHTPEPEAYARDYLKAAEAARHVAPTVKLLIAADYQEAEQTGGSSPTEMTWIDDMFTAAPTLGKWIDGVSVHPYGGDPSTPLAETGGYLDASGVWGFQRINTIREKFLAHGVNVPFWITEEGWSTWDSSEATIAHYYSDLIAQIKDRPWVRALFPFGLREDDPHPTNDQPGFGLLKYGTREPKAAWPVLQEGFKALS
jgi:hypothetical protein